jgi:hypothetical protein
VPFEGIFLVSGRGVILEGVASFLLEERLHQRSGLVVDDQSEVELQFFMSSFSTST